MCRKIPSCTPSSSRLIAALAFGGGPARAVRRRRPDADHAARRLHHRRSRLLARLALAPPAEDRIHQHRLRRHVPAAAAARVPYDGDNEGHGGYAATGIADQNQLPPWLAAARPDIVLMHLGTNDMWGNFRPTEIRIAAYTKLVGQMRANNPNMKILVAQIIPMNPSGCADVPPARGRRSTTRSRAGPPAQTTAQSPIIVVDQWTGFDTTTDTGDGVHPNDAGFQKMADRWYPPLAAAPRRPTTRQPRPPPRPPTRPPVGACAATYRVVGQWNRRNPG